MWRLFRWLLTLAVLGGLGGAIAIPAANWLKERSRPRYLTAKVSRGRIESVVNSTGTIKPVRSVQVGAFVSGPLEKVYVDFNTKVTKDQLMARIDPRLLKAAMERDKAALETQEAELERVEALLKQAENNEKRARNLQKINRDYLSDQEMDQFIFNRKSLAAQKRLAEATIKQARATLENSTANLGYTEIRSPVDGVVIERKVDDGQTVAASFQTPELFIVAPDLDKEIYVYASVDEADVGQIKEAKEKNKPVEFTVDAYPRLFTGSIHQVRMSSTTTQNVVTYPVVIVTENPELKLMPGMTANISFQIESRDDVLRVPAAALRFVPTVAARVRPEDRYRLDAVPRSPQEGATKQSAKQKTEAAKSRSKRTVWVRDSNDLLRAVDVTLGLIDNQYAELIAGDLGEGDEVITALDTSPLR